MLVLYALLGLVAAQNVTYTVPLTAAVNDTLTFQRIARGVVLNVLQVRDRLGECFEMISRHDLQVEVNLAPCAVRYGCLGQCPQIYLYHVVIKEDRMSCTTRSNA